MEGSLLLAGWLRQPLPSLWKRFSPVLLEVLSGFPPLLHVRTGAMKLIVMTRGSGSICDDSGGASCSAGDEV